MQNSRSLGYYDSRLEEKSKEDERSFDDEIYLDAGWFVKAALGHCLVSTILSP